MSTPTNAQLNDVDALEQLRAYPVEVHDIYRLYRQRDALTPEQALRKILQTEAEDNRILETIGIHVDGRG